MNKKVNTLLFILGATLFNILITVICFALLLVIYAKSILPHIPEGDHGWGFPLIFCAAMAISFMVYRVVLKLLVKKVNVEKYFDPVFRGRTKQNGSTPQSNNPDLHQ